MNRKTLPGEYALLDILFYPVDRPYQVRDMFSNDVFAEIWSGDQDIGVFLYPGEGKLLRLEPVDEHIIRVPQEYSKIQSAIDMSDKWCTILVAPGTYYENLNFNGRNPTVTSYIHWFPHDTSYINQTIIDGSKPADPTKASVVSFVSGEDSNATLKGFTIKNGKGSLYINDKGVPGTFGGGIYCKNSSPTIINNVIIGDTVGYDGGGIYCKGSSPRIFKNLIRQNKAGDYGGGIAITPNYSVTSGPILSNNVIVDNFADNYGGGIYYFGRPTITNNTIDGNSSTNAGGGIFVGAGYGRMENNIITNSLHGGGIRGISESVVISYNNLWNNVDGDFAPGFPYGLGDTSWGENRNGIPCDSFYNIFQDPDFNDGYHLNSQSACINAGNNSAAGLPDSDFDDNPRISDDFVDLGAYEYQSGSLGGGAKIAISDTSSKNKTASSVPQEFELSQNHPNPFNPATNIRFTVGSGQSPAQVTLKIYNIAGQLVRILVDEEKALGMYTIGWDGKNDSGEDVSSGIYFYQLKTNELSESKRMALIK